ncbi:MAG: hypothetical protein QOF52_2997, partial [Propionibacteriaceae bacterium]|nr:hypothetical protein [Propionibacteriaceae bacterium]
MSWVEYRFPTADSDRQCNTPCGEGVLVVVSTWLKRMLPGVQQQMWESYR